MGPPGTTLVISGMSLAPSWRHFGLRWPLFGLWGALFGLSGSLADLCWGLLGSLGRPLVTLGLFFTWFCGGFLERHGESSEHLEIHPVCIYIGRPYSAMRGWESWDRETSDIDGVFTNYPLVGCSRGVHSSPGRFDHCYLCCGRAGGNGRD